MPEKRKRVVIARPTRNGCLICRLRRVKCDEAKPACNNCIRTRRVCSGYPPTGGPAKPTNTRQLLPVQSTNLNLSPEPLSHLDATDYERFAFDHFRRTTVRQTHLNTPRAKITQLVLQLSLEVPVFRAIAALGSIHRSLVQITHVGSMDTLALDHDTLSQYGRAIASLQQHIADASPRSQRLLEPVLCACILLASCEILRNDTTAAISHFRFGRRISAESQASDPSMRSLKPHDGNASNMLISMFKLVEESYLVLGAESNQSGLPISNPPGLLDPIKSLRARLDWLISAGQELRAELLLLAQLDTFSNLVSKSVVEQSCIDQCNSRIVEPGIDNDVLTCLQQLINQHACWFEKFKTTMSALDPTSTSNKMNRCLILMQIQHFYSTFLLVNCRSTRENQTDIFRHEYIRILDLAEQYLGNFPRNSDSKINSAVQPVVLPALYLIALKCRDSLIRHRAVRLMATTDRLEGFQRSQSLAAFAEVSIEAEERSARTLMGHNDEPLRAEQVPEAARFLDVVVSLAPGSPSDVQIVGGRFAVERNGVLEVTVLSGESSQQKLALLVAR